MIIAGRVAPSGEVSGHGKKNELIFKMSQTICGRSQIPNTHRLSEIIFSLNARYILFCRRHGCISSRVGKDGKKGSEPDYVYLRRRNRNCAPDHSGVGCCNILSWSPDQCLMRQSGLCVIRKMVVPLYGLVTHPLFFLLKIFSTGSMYRFRGLVPASDDQKG
jgi:hypothetical protein